MSSLADGAGARDSSLATLLREADNVQDCCTLDGFLHIADKQWLSILPTSKRADLPGVRLYDLRHIVAKVHQSVGATCGKRPRGGTVYTRDLKSRTQSPQHTSQQSTSGDTNTSLAHQLAQNIRNDADLQRLIAAWPALPDVIKRAMLALIDAR